MKRVGYARVSTLDQHTGIQKRALLAAGCHRVIEEKASGAISRPRLNALLKTLRAGDTLVVHKLDRLARSMTHFIRVFEDLKTRNIKFQSLTENIETETPQGRMFLHLLAAFAELERELIRERCLSGQIAARARGQVWGRKPSFTPKEGAEIAKLWRSGWWEQQTMAHWLGVNISTLRDTIYRSENRGRYATNKLQK